MNILRTWTDPKGSRLEKAGRERVDDARHGCVRRLLPLAFGIGPEKHGGVVPDALGNGVDRDAAVEEQGRVGPPEVEGMMAAQLIAANMIPAGENWPVREVKSIIKAR